MAARLAYDGGGFRGFQRQPGARTVEGELVSALEACGLPASLAFASRTDAGVHARGQVIVWRAPAGADPVEVGERLGARLPPDVRLQAVAPAPAHFHPRWSALGKRYEYRLAAGDEPRADAWVVLGTKAALPPIDLAAPDAAEAPAQPESGPSGPGRTGLPAWPAADPVRALADLLVALGPPLQALREAPDLGGFTGAGAKPGAAPPLTSLEVRLEGSDLLVVFEGPAFRRYAVRNLIGGAVAEALGWLAPGTCARTAGAPPPYRRVRAPAQGLSLAQVFYPPELDPFGPARVSVSGTCGSRRSG